MVKRTLIALSMSAVLGSPAFAGQCPGDMAAIDEALSANPELSAEDLDLVKQLRAEGEELHNSGNHAESVEVLAEAKALLGME